MSTLAPQDVMNTHDLAEKLTRPGRELAALALDSTEKLVELQLDAARMHTSVALSQVRAMASIHDMESLQQYLANQAELAKTLGERVAEDAETAAGIGNDLANGAVRIAQANATHLGDAPRSTEPVPAEPAPAPAKRSTPGKATTAGSAKRATSSAAGKRSGVADSRKSAP